MLFRPNSEHDSSVNDYANNFKRTTGKKINVLNYDSPEGQALAKVHDITSIPVILALRDDDSLMEMWPEQDKWPTVSELSFYTQNE